MLKAIAIGLSLLAGPTLVADEAPKPTTTMLQIHCGTTAGMTKSLKDQNEKLIFFGEDDSGTITMVFRDPNQTDWYIMTANKANPERTCQVLDGGKSEFVLPTPMVPQRQALKTAN
jgi:hypothetical protein